MLPAETVLSILAWGIVVGLDLVSFPQALLGRPVVAGVITGFLMGNLSVGVEVGVLVELFALNTLAIGSARYPDLGSGTVPGTVAAAVLGPGDGAIAMGVVLALVLGQVGQASLGVLRRWNGASVRKVEAQLERGDAPGLFGRLQRAGIVRDALRSLTLSGGGLLAVALAPPLPPPVATSMELRWVVLGGGLVAAAVGLLRSVARGSYWRWMVLGMLAGLLLTGRTG